MKIKARHFVRLLNQIKKNKDKMSKELLGLKNIEYLLTSIRNKINKTIIIRTKIEQQQIVIRDKMNKSIVRSKLINH